VWAIYKNRLFTEGGYECFRRRGEEGGSRSKYSHSPQGISERGGKHKKGAHGKEKQGGKIKSGPVGGVLRSGLSKFIAELRTRFNNSIPMRRRERRLSPWHEEDA
jgi:hypothetical protein